MIRIYDLTVDHLDEGVMATYAMNNQDLQNYDDVLQSLEDHMCDVYSSQKVTVRAAVRPDLPIPVHHSGPLYMYFTRTVAVQSVLEQKLRMESKAHVIRSLESILEDLMFGIITMGNERIPYRLDCDTRLQFNLNQDIDVTVLCNTVDFVVPTEWDGDFESVLEKVDELLVHHGFTRGFGTTPKINPLRV